MHDEIQNRLTSANECYFSLLKLLKSKHLYLMNQRKSYTPVRYIRPILTYGCETWSTTKGNHQSLIIPLKEKCMALYITEKQSYLKEGIITNYGSYTEDQILCHNIQGAIGSNG